MQSFIQKSRWLAGLVLTVAFTASHAAPVFHHSLASFNAAASATLVDDFEGFSTVGNLTGPQNFDDPDVFYQGQNADPSHGANVVVIELSGDAALAANGQELIQISFTAPVKAVGFDGIGNDGDFRIEVYEAGNGSLFTYDFFPGNGDHTFFGATSSAGISSVRWISHDNWYKFTSGIDNVRVDKGNVATVSSVPEPDLLALLSMGLVGLGYARRKTA